MKQQRSHKKNSPSRSLKLFSFFKPNILVDKTLVFLEINSNELIQGKAHQWGDCLMNLMI